MCILGGLFEFQNENHFYKFPFNRFTLNHKLLIDDYLAIIYTTLLQLSRLDVINKLLSGRHAVGGT